MRKILFFVVCVLVLCVRYWFFVQDKGDPRFLQEINQKVELEGIVVEEPDIRENSVKLVVGLQTFGKENQEVQPTKILVFDDAYSKIAYGDKVKIIGKLEKPENFEGDNGRMFNYISYLAKDKIFYQISFARVEKISGGHGNIFKASALKIKSYFISSLNNSLPYLESKLAGGLVVAGKRALPKNIQDEFIKTGTIQVVVLSGYNVTIIADALISALSFLPVMVGFGVSTGVLILFAIATGGSATIIRALLMVLIATLGKSMRRPYDAGRALLVAGFLMLLANPMLLFFDPSFQLSFVATFGLIYGTPVVDRFLFSPPAPLLVQGEGRPSFARWGENVPSKLKPLLASTIATQIFVTPLILYMTGVLSLVALPANIILSLIVPLTMLASFVTGLLGLLSPLLALPASIPAFLLLKFMLGTVHFFASMPFSAFTIPSFPFWLLVLAYVCFLKILFNNRPI